MDTQCHHYVPSNFALFKKFFRKGEKSKKWVFKGFHIAIFGLKFELKNAIRFVIYQYNLGTFTVKMLL